MTTFTVERPSTPCWAGRRPRTEKLNTASDGAWIEYLPSALVTVRISVPWTRTATPRSGVPPVEVTVPDTVTCCANAVPLRHSASSKLLPMLPIAILPVARMRFRSPSDEKGVVGGVRGGLRLHIASYAATQSSTDTPLLRVSAKVVKNKSRSRHPERSEGSAVDHRSKSLRNVP